MLNRDFRDIFAVLEGGYNVKYLPLCIDNFLAGINGKPSVGDEPPTRSIEDVSEEFDSRLSRLLSAHRGKGLL